MSSITLLVSMVVARLLTNFLVVESLPLPSFVPPIRRPKKNEVHQSKRSKLYYAENDLSRISLNKRKEKSNNFKYNTQKAEQVSERNHKQQQQLELYENNKLDLQLLLLDNYDSYTYNLYSYLCTLCKHKPIVVSNDAYASWDDLIQEGMKGKNIDGIIISPGPGRPERVEDMGVCIEVRSSIIFEKMIFDNCRFCRK